MLSSRYNTSGKRNVLRKMWFDHVENVFLMWNHNFSILESAEDLTFLKYSWFVFITNFLFRQNLKNVFIFKNL